MSIAVRQYPWTLTLSRSISMSIYCTYITFYRGNKLPPFYIGSTSVDLVSSGYRGSVSSKEYKTIWKSELKENPQLFKTKIISTHEDRKDALAKEEKLHKSLNVVKSSLYVNKSTANINGFFGMNVKGELNPNYGRPWSIEEKKFQAERMRSRFINSKIIHIYNETNHKVKMIDILESEKYLNEGWKIGRALMKTKNITKSARERIIIQNSTQCSCVVCKQIIKQADKINDHYKRHHDLEFKGLNLEYFGKFYKSYKHLREEGNCTKGLYKNYYLLGFDPRVRIGKDGPPRKSDFIKLPKEISL